MNIAQIRLVARQELTDMFRNRQVWLGLLLQPVLFLLLFGLIGYFVEQRSAAFETEEFKVLVHGVDEDLAPFTLTLRAARFRVTRSDDLEQAVVGGDAEIGIAIPRGAAQDLKEGRRVRVQINYIQSRDQSQVALGRARVALDAFAREQTKVRLRKLGVSEDLADPLDVRATDVATTERGARLELAHLLPGLLLMQSGSLISTAAQRISGSKEKRTFEPLITLPIKRRDLLIGAGVASFVIGLIPAVMFVVPIVIISLLPVAFAAGLSSPFAVAAGLLLAAPLLAALLSVVGLALGTVTRTGEGGSSIAGLAFVPLMALGYLFLFIDNLPDAPAFFAIPVYGVGLFVREAVGDSIDVVHLAIAAAGTIGLALVLLAVASRALDTERSILRAS